MKPLISAVCVLFVLAGLSAGQTLGWQPSPGHTQVPIWPGIAPDSQPVTGPETSETSTTREKDQPPLMSSLRHLVAGKPWTYVERVSRPTMTVYSPEGKNTGVAVVVLPGGGFQFLSIDIEGTEACDWLTSKGITCVLLKYRVPDSGPHGNEQCKCQVNPKAPTALQDMQRTVGLVRFHAAEWHIDPHKVGVLGFSAGGYLVAAISTQFSQRLYPLVDAADKESCRPDFAMAIYPGHLCEWPGHPCSNRSFELNPSIPVTRETPPTFLLQNEDDHVDNVNDSLVYYIALKNAGVPVEMHLYTEGGHAFGLRPTNLPVTHWPQFAQKWLATIGVISQ
jgi:acetyl esterase/lipase